MTVKEDHSTRRSASFFISRLHAETKRLRNAGFPGRTAAPQTWLDLVEGALETASSYLDEADHETDPKLRRNLIKSAEVVASDSYVLLKHIDDAHANKITHQVVAPFLDWAKKLQIKNTLFFKAEHLANYELRSIDYNKAARGFNNPSPKLTAAREALNWPAYSVSVPSEAMAMLPHYAVVGHELGHALANEVKEDVSKFNAHHSKTLSAIYQWLDQSGPYDKKDVAVRINAILPAWITEIKADAIGSYIAGPAFFFALCGFLELSERGYGVTTTHPPVALRRNLLYAGLNKGSVSFAKVFKEKAQLILTETINSPNLKKLEPSKSLHTDLAEKLKSNIDAAICMELPTYLEVIAPTIVKASHKLVHDRCPELQYTPKKLGKDLDFHLDALCALIPPIEYREAGTLKPCDLSTILNVGWAVLLTRMEQFGESRATRTSKKAHPIHSSRDAAAKMASLHELLLKAVELSEAKKTWDQTTTD